MDKKYWMSPIPAECQICEDAIVNEFIDGRTISGLWGIFCPTCHKIFGVGLGVGLGQKYSRDAEGHFVKVAG